VPVGRPHREPRGGFPLWAVAAGLLLAGGIAAGVFFLLKKPEEVTKEQPAGPTPNPQPVLPHGTGSADRHLAEWAMEKGGGVRVEGEPNFINDRSKLPIRPIRVTGVGFAATYRPTDADLELLRGCDSLRFLDFTNGCDLTDAGLQAISELPTAK